MYVATLNQYVIVASSVVGTTSIIDFDPDNLMNTYSLVVTCEINPTSSADYCEVIARNDDTTISGKLCTYILLCIIVCMCVCVCAHCV